MFKQSLALKLQQKLSPQQIQLMKLFQVPTAQLEERIKEELELNPALEDGAANEEDENNILKDLEEEQSVKDADDTSVDNDELTNIDEYLSPDDLDTPDYKLNADNYDPNDEEEDKKSIPTADTNLSFQEYLEEQLSLSDLSDEHFLIAQQIIGSVDDDGYMSRPLDAMVDDLAFSMNIITDIPSIESILHTIQSFDPPGVAARNLQECLLLQLNRRDTHTPLIRLAIEIISNHFEEFKKKHYEKIARSLEISEEVMKLAIDILVRLNPKPGSAFIGSGRQEQYVIPDFIILNNEGELTLTLNARNAPELRISNSFKDMLREYQKGAKQDKQQKEALIFIKQKLDSAKWFIDAIKQRQHTLLLVMRSILDKQLAYFQTGDETMLKPMILKDIAEKTGLDISTVSRVANSKFVQTEFGTLSLKSFFSESLSTDSGEEVSTKEVKKILQDLIDAESKKKPLSDEFLMQELNRKGYNIARRTVAKYREQLNIPVARLRKEL